MVAGHDRDDVLNTFRRILDYDLEVRNRADSDLPKVWKYTGGMVAWYKHGRRIPSWVQYEPPLLHRVCRDGCLAAAEFLLQQKQGPGRDFIFNHSDERKWATSRASPLFQAVDGEHLDVVRLLLQQPDISVEQASVDLASRRGNLEALKLLLRQHRPENISNGNIEAATWNPRTPLHEAARHGQADAAAILLQHDSGVGMYSDNGSEEGIFFFFGSEWKGRHDFSRFFPKFAKSFDFVC